MKGQTVMPHTRLGPRSVPILHTRHLQKVQAILMRSMIPEASLQHGP